jgi:3-hydroxybutyryl-CoA dehydrogenase
VGRATQLLTALAQGKGAPDPRRITLRPGLGYPEGSLAMLERTGLAHHLDIARALYEQLGDPA